MAMERKCCQEPLPLNHKPDWMKRPILHWACKKSGAGVGDEQ